jgi:acyl-CoA synthetase (AMP-forming)/AMP-acid ligase II
MAFARAHLAAPFIPVQFVFVDRLPCTASTKVAVGEVRKLLFARLGIVDPQAKLPA